MRAVLIQQGDEDLLSVLQKAIMIFRSTGLRCEIENDEYGKYDDVDYDDTNYCNEILSKSINQ